MRPRTPTLIWIPFVFSIAGISWLFLLASLAIFSGVILAPALQDVRLAQIQRNDIQATVDLLDKKLALQKQFIDVSTKDPLVLERLAARELRLGRADQEILVLDPASLHKDQSVTSLLAQSLSPVAPQPVADLPWFLKPILDPTIRKLLLIAASLALALGFMLGVRYDPPENPAPPQPPTLNPKSI